MMVEEGVGDGGGEIDATGLDVCIGHDHVTWPVVEDCVRGLVLTVCLPAVHHQFTSASVQRLLADWP
ncbi:hypothetical protein PoB_000138100 [Plakobranchus ocellatus]|uniref:Uncharacterized protein n=1 Tax=Plakobranchus ocellatus TaxID=259542 RepID=A0AAV3XXS8_9GAST|nr:hypothetical protein PoB_000138100 [Plakobranchus ocellatus]